MILDLVEWDNGKHIPVMVNVANVAYFQVWSAGSDSIHTCIHFTGSPDNFTYVTATIQEICEMTAPSHS
jgi:hypothetical protein